MAPANGLRDRFWARHSNPVSGYTRIPLGSFLLFALYVRHWRLVGLILAYVALNPILFPEPERTDAWVSRAVLGEQRWTEDGHGVFEASRPGVLNALSALAYGVALYGAYRRKAILTAVGGDLALTFKLAYLQEVVEYYDERTAKNETSG